LYLHEQGRGFACTETAFVADVVKGWIETLIDDLAFMVLAAPIFYPAIGKLGYDPLWFGMIIAITVMIGVVIPPVAINVFVVRAITKIPFGVIYAVVYPFLLSLFFCAVLLFLFPGIATFLPKMLMG